jgi:hypothetical protein
MRPLKFSSLSSITLSAAALCGANLLSGCAVGNLASPSSVITRTPTVVSGTVHGGQNPIGGSLVQLWETGGGTAGAAATATATLGTGPAPSGNGTAVGTIASIAVTSAGSGYTSAPTVMITDTTGTGASATAILSATDGTIASISVSSGGSGYTSPAIALKGGIASNAYGQGAIQLVASTTTAAGTGAFNFGTANVASNCKTGPYTYITANGGDPTGATQGNVNPAIELVAVLGSCSSTGASTNVAINELTTVAAAYALGNFATDSTGTINIGAPLSNSQGMADAVANAQLLVNSATGVANASTTTMVLPTAMINSLGNSIAACINIGTTSNTATTSCTNLFSYATPPGGTSPTDTFQAAVNIAKYPGNNVSSILNLASATAAPFVPRVSVTSVSSTTAPIDLTLGISYPNTTLLGVATTRYNVGKYGPNTPVGITIDASDNVWTLGATTGSSLTSSNYNLISELTSSSSTPAYTSTPGSIPALDATHTIRTGAFDTLGNFWLSDKNATGGSLIEIPSGAALSGANELTAFSTLAIASPNTGSFDPNDWWVSIDGSNNLWTASYGGAGNCTTGTTGGSGTVCDYIEYQRSGATTPATYTPTASFAGNLVGVSTSRGGVVDTTSTAGLGNVWATSYSIFGAAATAGTVVEVLTPSAGTAATITLGSTAAQPQGVALDAAGNGWITTNASTATSGLWKVPQGTTTGSISSVVPTTGQSSLTGIATTASTPKATSALQVGGLNLPGYDVVDGAGNIWIANYTYGTTVEYSPSMAAYLSPYYGFSPSLTTSPAVTATITQASYNSSTAGNANIYATNNISVGQTVTISGVTGTFACLNGGPFPVTALGASLSSYVSITGTSCAADSKGGAAATSGTVTVNSSNQAVFTCSGTCAVNAGQVPTNNYISIDRAGTVWSMNGAGTVTGIIGTAAPTNPVLAAGQAGKLP